MSKIDKTHSTADMLLTVMVRLNMGIVDPNALREILRDSLRIEYHAGKGEAPPIGITVWERE